MKFTYEAYKALLALLKKAVTHFEIITITGIPPAASSFDTISISV